MLRVQSPSLTPIFQLLGYQLGRSSPCGRHAFRVARSRTHVLGPDVLATLFATKAAAGSNEGGHMKIGPPRDDLEDLCARAERRSTACWIRRAPESRSIRSSAPLRRSGSPSISASNRRPDDQRQAAEAWPPGGRNERPDDYCLGSNSGRSPEAGRRGARAAQTLPSP
jgi:hypothetical protein